MALLTWAVLLLAGLTYTNAVGTQTPIENVSSIAQVDFRLVSAWRTQCACSVVTNYHCLTAASCVDTSSNNRRVRVGSATRGIGGIIRDLAIITIHPDYASNNYEGNIAIVRATNSWYLGGPELNNAVLVPQGYFLGPHVELSISGWGVTTQGGLIPDRNLYTAIVESKSTQTCAQRYPGRITANMVCVGLIGTNGRDFDPSDTGAPVHYLGFLYGVVSFGESAANNEAPIVASAIGSYGNWIRANAI